MWNEETADHILSCAEYFVYFLASSILFFCYLSMGARVSKFKREGKVEHVEPDSGKGSSAQGESKITKEEKVDLVDSEIDKNSVTSIDESTFQGEVEMQSTKCVSATDQGEQYKFSLSLHFAIPR